MGVGSLHTAGCAFPQHSLAYQPKGMCVVCQPRSQSAAVSARQQRVPVPVPVPVPMYGFCALQAPLLSFVPCSSASLGTHTYTRTHTHTHIHLHTSIHRQIAPHPYTTNQYPPPSCRSSPLTQRFCSLLAWRLEACLSVGLLVCLAAWSPSCVYTIQYSVTWFDIPVYLHCTVGASPHRLLVISYRTLPQR